MRCSIFDLKEQFIFGGVTTTKTYEKGKTGFENQTEKYIINNTPLLFFNDLDLFLFLTDSTHTQRHLFYIDLNREEIKGVYLWIE
jgi:hypothetical protein